MTRVRNIKTYKGNNGVRVCRGTIFGNPYIIGKDGDRSEVIQKYKEYVPTQPKIIELLPTLKDRDLLCFCWPLPCHADILAELADKEENKDKNE